MRSCHITTRFSEEEKQEVEQQADLAAISVSDYIRRRVLGHPVQSKGDLRVLAELRRQGGLLKHLYNETRGAYSEDFSQAIRANEAYYHDLLKEISSGKKENS
jgi:hypothetical protein